MLLGRDLIYDVGLNIGMDTAFYLSRGYRVVAIEADPTLAEGARRRFQQEIAQGRLEILNVGISTQDGFADFWICDDKPVFNSFDRRIAARNSFKHHKIQIPTLRFTSILSHHGTPYYLKIDIEGNDQLCLADLQPPALPRYVSLESECPGESVRVGPEEGLRALERLHSLGYRHFKLIDQNTFCALSLPISLSYRIDSFSRRVLLNDPAKRIKGSYRLACQLLVRKRIERRFSREFPLGASGTWGEDTDGYWMTHEQAHRSYLHYRKLHFESPTAQPFSFWCDWHARL